MYLKEIDVLIESHLKSCATQATLDEITEGAANALVALLSARRLVESQSAPAGTPVAATAPQPEPVAESAPVVEEKTYSYEDDVKPAVRDVAKILGRDKCLELFKEFGADKGPDLKPEQYGPFVQKAEALIEAHKKANG